MAQHVLYELTMLHRMEAEYAMYAGSGVGSAVIESFAIHARNLHSFFFAGNDVVEDDVIAEDYLPNAATKQAWQIARNSLQLDEILKTIHPRAAKRLAHVTYARLAVSDADKPWDMGRISDAFVPVIREWLQGVDPALLPGWPQDWKTRTRFI